MVQLVIVEQDPAFHPLLQAVAIRLADEGIPVRAIARSIRMPSEDLYDILRTAIELGKIVELPKDDWPVGSARAQRACIAGTILENDETLAFACSRFFKSTRQQSAVLAVMLKRNEITKAQIHQILEQNRPTEGREATDPKLVDVVVCHLRKKLKPHNVEIETIWGTGYLIPPKGRELAVRLLENFTSSAPVVDAAVTGPLLEVVNG